MFDKAKLYNNVIKPAFLNIPIDIVKHTNTKVTDLLNLVVLVCTCPLGYMTDCGAFWREPVLN